MKKILIFVPALVIILTGCSANIEEVSTTYDVFKESMSTSPYVLVETISEGSITLDYTSETEYIITSNFDDVEYEFTCTGDATSTLKSTVEDDLTDEVVNELCKSTYETLIADYTNNVENPMFFNSEYLVDYSKTASGFKAVGEYDDESAYSLTLNSDSTEVVFSDDNVTIEVSLK